MLQWLQDIVIVAFDLDNGQNAARNIIRDISPLLNDVGRIHKFSYPREPSTILISDPKTIENFIPPINNNKITALKNDTSFHCFILLLCCNTIQHIHRLWKVPLNFICLKYIMSFIIFPKYNSFIRGFTISFDSTFLNIATRCICRYYGLLVLFIRSSRFLLPCLIIDLSTSNSLKMNNLFLNTFELV